MVDVDEVTDFVSVEACGGIGFVAMIVEFFAVIAACEGGRGCPDYYCDHKDLGKSFHLYLNNSIASAPVIPTLIPSLVASLDTAFTDALSISS